MENLKMYKQIFSLRLAGWLMLNGFRIRRIHHNLKEANKDVYLFDDTPELEKAMLEYRELKNTKENNYANFNRRSRNKNEHKNS